MSVLSIIFLLIVIAYLSIICMGIMIEENNYTAPVYMLIAVIAICGIIYIKFHPKETAEQKSINERYNQLTAEKGNN